MFLIVLYVTKTCSNYIDPPALKTNHLPPSSQYHPLSPLSTIQTSFSGKSWYPLKGDISIPNRVTFIKGLSPSQGAWVFLSAAPIGGVPKRIASVAICWNASVNSVAERSTEKPTMRRSSLGTRCFCWNEKKNVRRVRFGTSNCNKKRFWMSFEIIRGIYCD